MPEAVHYELSGPDTGPPLMLSGSLGTDMSMWDPQVEPLSARFRLIRYDQRGHGRSPVPPGPYTIAELGQDLIALLDRLEIEQASICGLSIGGMTGMWVAAHAPERLERLALLCTSASLGPESVWRERAQTVRTQGLDVIADAGMERWFTEGFRQEHPGTVARLRASLTSQPPEGYAGCCEAIATMDLRADLSRITAPTLVVAGENDPATPPTHGLQIADAVAGARFEVIAPAAHLASVEQPERITELILPFLSEESS